MNKTNQGKQTLLELTGALVHTKDLFRDAATTRVIMEMLRFTYLFTCEVVPPGPGRASQGTSAPGCSTLSSGQLALFSFMRGAAGQLSAVCRFS
jgi:hypothetical protein